ncbi:hypothetical protein BGW36DRAFT_388500 [Talaromyces proteolyticus]|uniref:Carrier domain-containing protein n=1 Tax=Talaromyces proteolyticus TaxID=1131652 RepID=A0AAD4PTY5_9EURO|nr:uncharacterized protein BGW36DRAFT_388500 [Talaromyces proteolyticus]KAH8691535.1 hypothetical protein BGW36DRAFT_388500 [Talaromyces proteolyticus]
MGSIGLDSTSILRRFDAILSDDPGRLYCVHPLSADISEGWREISFADLAGAVEHLSTWIKDNVAVGEEPATLAYMGTNDVRYVAFILACMRLGHAVLLLSSRNSEEASLHVLKATACTRFVYSPERSREIEALKTADPSLDVYEVPSLWEVFDRSTTSSFALNSDATATSDQEDRVVIYIHSSGTTGLPKPVPLTNGYFSALVETGRLPTPPGRVSSLVFVAEKEKHLFVMSPFFHFMGLLSMITPIFFSTPLVLGPDKPLTSELLSQIIDDTNAKTAILPPSILEEFSSSDIGLKCLGRFCMVAYGGAPLAAEAGNRIATVTHLQSVLGSSECGLFAGLKNQDPSDWRYLEWNPSHKLEMRDTSDGLYELVVPRGEDRNVHSVFHTYPNNAEYHTGDLFLPHPKVEGSWLYHGRLDDIIVLSNGEKFNPTTMEAVICSHPHVARAIVLGQGRFQSAVLIEPDRSVWTDEDAVLIADIWPTVQKANEGAARHARLMKDRIGVASPSKPFKITPKGTIQRRRVINDYSDEIEALYARSVQDDAAQVSLDATPQEIAAYIEKALLDILPMSSIHSDEDIFALGLDSLQTLRLGRILHSALRTALPELPSSAFSSQLLYSHSTIAKLSDYIYTLLEGRDSPPVPAVIESTSDRSARIANLVDKYSYDLGESHCVILTGSTGSLGSYLLNELLRDSSVHKIYCLNRSADAAPRQLQSLQEKGLVTFDQFPARVEFLQAQFGEERLGLDETKYEELLHKVDTIIHNAWKVNFNHRAEAFESPHIAGVRRLVDFCIASDHTTHLHFISSISTIEGYSIERGPSIPETIFDDPSVALHQGYGESKHVSERICAGASAKCGVPTSIHRVGQIGGPTTEKGMWNKQEWLPSLVATSKTIKQIPSSLGSVSVQWVPVDITAKVVTEIVRARRQTQESQPCAAFHIVNPTAADWKTLIPAVTKYFDAELVDIQTWIDTLESFTSPTEEDLKDKPALKILDFFRGIAMGEGERGPWTETTKTQAASHTLRTLKAIDTSLMETWMMQWKF